jgi:hypothetical protein
VLCPHADAFVERLATQKEEQAGMLPPEVPGRTLGELQRRYRQEPLGSPH